MAVLRLYVAQAESQPHRAQVLRVDDCAVGRRMFAVRIASLRDEHGWSFGQIAMWLDIDRSDARRMCCGGRASAEQLETVLAHAKRAA